jgi:hypothetical protein
MMMKKKKGKNNNWNQWRVIFPLGYIKRAFGGRLKFPSENGSRTTGRTARPARIQFQRTIQS